MVVNIRQANTADTELIRALTREAYAKWVPVIGREPLPMSADYDKALQEHRFDLLYADGVLSGLIEMIVLSDHLLIENVAVLPAFQGRGFGRRLLAHAEAVAAVLGFAEIRLYTNAAFTENLSFYDRLGYAIERREPFRGGFTVYFRKAVGVDVAVDSGPGQNP